MFSSESTKAEQNTSTSPDRDASLTADGQKKKPTEPAKVPVSKSRLEQAEARADQAERRTAQARTRTESAETRTEQAETRTEQAETRTEQAESRTELAKTRTEQAEIRSEQAETILESALHHHSAPLPPNATRLHQDPPLDGTADLQSPLARLTARQREILLLIAQGQNTKQIADTVKISHKTVEYHRARLMNCLQMHDVAGLVRFALREGLVSAES
jgi:DNA-binding CsgD family transcriptional regulator